MNRPRPPDAPIAVVLAALPHVFGVQPAAPAALVVSAVAALALAVRRMAPLPTLAMVITAAGAGLAFGPGLLPAAAYALYTVAAERPAPRRPAIRRAGAVTAAGAIVLLLGGPAGSGPPPIVSWALLGAALLGVAWTTGRAVAERRAATLRDLDRARLDERLRIAREMHDVVTHGMGLIAVQAGTANHVAADRPEEAARALAVIEEVSRRSLTELRTMLGVLRDGTGEAGLTPSPRLTDLPALVASARAAGVEAELTVRDAADVPEGVELAAYRIVQEALSNVARHAAPTRCTILVEGTANSLSLDVSDEGPAKTSTRGNGYGLIGMRERALTHNGTFTAGPRPDGGFTVHATLAFQSAH
ncbi:sensor histidine kinase [Actinomadura hibisca]|uniref:sensor histidine kinase n=1 Tax=Actinomadura hibisca TaxID=68565 RepID=UPI00082C36E8|nr:histidine kinase [Actinomadura hibisca]